MELVKTVFDCAKIYRLKSRSDNRGPMTCLYDGSIEDFEIKETRSYTMPKKGTFFGIHYREEKDPMAKLVSVIKGRGMDYLVDLRKNSPTYLKWESIELSAENALSVLVPAGIGHAFLSLEDDTIHIFSCNKAGNDAHSKQLNYADKKIGLQLAIPISRISDYDQHAPCL